ncbi:MAG: PfaD family polyunsaturated fatty acid/polyketide biosynthesis protein [Desulfobacteraceae bacterium]|jgi:PfaD family protein
MEPAKGAAALNEALSTVTRPIYILSDNDGKLLIAKNGTAVLAMPPAPGTQSYPLLAFAPAIHPEALGDPLFKAQFNLRYAYVCGAMANGITSVEMVKQAGRAGMIGFFGAGGLSPQKVAEAIDQLLAEPKEFPFGFNLIHSPGDPELELEIVTLYINKGVRLISASAYMDLTLPLVYFRVKGIHRKEDGRIICPNQIVAKVSRVEVAQKFFAPPPEKFLNKLVEQQLITFEEAKLARNIPMVDALTAEADSGGHTDNRPALALLPTMLALRDKMTGLHGYDRPIFVGLGGGIATPDAATAAFAMGAAYILTGSINQGCVEAGTSPAVRQMLAEAQQADVTMAPAADMFELGVKVQVLKRGTMFPLKAAKLYELYRMYNDYYDIPLSQRNMLEQNFFKASFEEEWERTRSFFEQRDPIQIQRAEERPKHKMALVFRSYLGQSSRWANTGKPDRKIDYQIWCGPAMGAFNEWAKESFLENTENRNVVTIAMNLLYGTCVQQRANCLRAFGIPMAPDAGRIRPLELKMIEEKISV